MTNQNLNSTPKFAQNAPWVTVANPKLGHRGGWKGKRWGLERGLCPSTGNC